MTYLDNLKSADLVVYSAAISQDDIELLEGEEEYPEYLSGLAGDFRLCIV